MDKYTFKLSNFQLDLLFLANVKEKSYNVIGVMSGTSLDGVDLAHIHFEIENQKWSFQIIECETIGYSDDWLEPIENRC